MARDEDIPRCELCGSEYPDDPGAALACCSELATDGGWNSRLHELDADDDDLVDACPECDYTDIYLRGRDAIGRPRRSDERKNRCNRCKETFDDPNRRPRRHPGSQQGLAGVLEELGEQGKADLIGGAP